MSNELETRRRLRPLAICCLVVLLGGCLRLPSVAPDSPSAGASEARASVRSIGVYADDDANSTSAVAVDIVFVFDRTALSELPHLSPTWFGSNNAVLSRWRGKIKVARLELAPGFRVEQVELPDNHHDAVAVVAYASYFRPSGQAKLDLSGFVHPIVRLTASRAGVDEQ